MRITFLFILLSFLFSQDYNRGNKSFKAGLHTNHSDEHAKKLYKATRQGMNLQKEERGMLDFRTFLTEQC